MPSAWREAANTTFKVFSMTRPGIKPQFPGYQTDTLTDTPSVGCNGANSAKCFKFKAFNVKTQTDRLQTSPVFADHRFNALNLEKYAARYQTPHGPVFANHWDRASALEPIRWPSGIERLLLDRWAEGSIPSRVKPMTLKLVFTASLLDDQH